MSLFSFLAGLFRREPAPPPTVAPLPMPARPALPAVPAPAPAPAVVPQGRAITAQVVAMVGTAEGFRSHPYKPASGNPNEPWTIGKGSTRDLRGQPVTATTLPVTPEEADRMLARDLRDAAAVLDRVVTVALSDGQYGALASFVHNIGPGKKGVKDGLVELKGGGQSTLLRRLNAGDFVGAAGQFALWATAGGNALLGLRRRRAAERAIFQGGSWRAAWDETK